MVCGGYGVGAGWPACRRRGIVLLEIGLKGALLKGELPRLLLLISLRRRASPVMLLLLAGSPLCSPPWSRISMCLVGCLRRAILLRNWLRLLRLRLRLLARLLGPLLAPSQSMALQCNLRRTSCTCHKITMHVLVHRNIGGRLRNRELALKRCIGRILSISIGGRRLPPFNDLLPL